MKTAISLVLFLTLSSFPVQAVILLNKPNNDAGITSDPGTGAPWKNVAQILNSSSNPAGSGVYLGNQYLLTANHVTVGSIVIDGQSFSVDSGFNNGGFSSGVQQIGTADLKVLRLSSDPELVVAGLVDINLNTSSTLDRNRDVTLIGFGRGRGTEVIGQGWNWGAGGTEDQRWGTNTTLNTIFNDGNTFLLATEFNDNGIDTEAALTLNDSGMGMFYEQGPNWFLSGIGVAVDVNGSSYYDRDLLTSGDQPDKSYFARISTYESQIADALATIPEPSSHALLLVALLTLFLARRTGLRSAL